MIFLEAGFLLLASAWLTEARAAECPSIESKLVKVEAWLSKRFKKELRLLRKEFTAIGNTRVILWVYPSENLSKIAAIGRCVPAYIARHTLRKAMEYYGGVNALVNQGFFFLQLDRSGHVPVCRQLSPTNSPRRTRSSYERNARYEPVPVTLPPTYYTKKEGKGLRSDAG